jgi:hypothetical protein
MTDDAPFIAPFEIIGWEQSSYGDEGERNELARVTVTKVFTGDIEGESAAELLMAGNPVGAGYVASELFTGVIGGRAGSLVIQHGGRVRWPALGARRSTRTTRRGTRSPSPCGSSTRASRRRGSRATSAG